MAHALRLMVLLLLIGVAPGLAWGLSIGQQDTFQDGSTNGWSVSLLDLLEPEPARERPDGRAGRGGRQLPADQRGQRGPGPETA